MDHILLINAENTPSCRYCLSEDANDFISPCKCDGTAKYVHKNCLKKWLDQKNEQIVLPGAFSQFVFQCEVCHTAYKFKENRLETTFKLWLEIAIYMVGITAFLTLSYICLGISIYSTGKLFVDRGGYWENIFINGFIITHVLLGIFYIVATILSCGNNTECDTCFFCMGCEGTGDDLFMLLIAFFCLGLLATIFLIYYDVINRVLQRHKNKTYHIEDILPYGSSLR